MDDLVKRLGFKMIEKHGSWQIQHVDKEGKVLRIQPVLIEETWKMWKLLVDMYTPIKKA
jgi:hypothetical protein